MSVGTRLISGLLEKKMSELDVQKVDCGEEVGWVVVQRTAAILIGKELMEWCIGAVARYGSDDGCSASEEEGTPKKIGRF